MKMEQMASKLANGKFDRRLIIGAGLVAGGLFAILFTLALLFVLDTDPSPVSVAEPVVKATPAPIATTVEPKSEEKIATKSRSPVFKKFTKKHSLDLYEDPPPTKNPDLSPTEYEKLVAGLVKKEWIEVQAPKGQPALLLPFLRIDLKEENKKFHWAVKSTEPIVFEGRPRGPQTSETIKVSVLPNLYKDAKTSAEAKRLTTIDWLRSSPRRRVVATDIQSLDDAETRFQFYLSVPSTHYVYQMIHDEDRVIIVEAFSGLEFRAMELHQLIGVPDLLTMPSIGNVPETVQAELSAVVAEAKRLIGSRKHEEVLRLLMTDEMIQQNEQSPEQFKQAIQQFDLLYKAGLEHTFSFMEFSKGTYLEHANTVRFPHPKSDIVWVKNGTRWCMK